MIKAIVFDFDDTLAPEQSYIDSGFEHIASVLSKELNQPSDTLNHQLQTLFRDNAKNVFNRLLDLYAYEYSQEYILTLIKEYRSHTPKIKFYEDVLPCLEDLRKKGYKLGIITDGYAVSQRKKLTATNADRYFDEIIVTDELGREYWKPHPLAFELISEKLDVSYSEMIYVGDNPEKDFYISSVFPVKTVRIIRDGIYKKRRYLQSVKEDYRINTLDFLDIFKEFER